MSSMNSYVVLLLILTSQKATKKQKTQREIPKRKIMDRDSKKIAKN